MRNSEQHEQDQRGNSGMEDNTLMTIEFLRARLLSERSVSGAARQRADELWKRVSELEEQLKIVSLQRKKAEKATEDLLAILENHGISEVSEAHDSSSDQENNCESILNCTPIREENSSGNSKERRNEKDENSFSELDSSAVDGRSLSWKGRKNSPHSLEKYKGSMRKGSSFASFGSSSSRHRQGKSCRQIRRRELRSVDKESKSEHMNDNVQENGVSASELSWSDAGSENIGELEIREGKILTQGSDSGYLGEQRAVTGDDLDPNSYAKDREMKEALQHQAQLIGQYEAMEKAQREWEEKYRENDHFMPDPCDPGNQSDVTEERDDNKEHYPQDEHVAVLLSKAQEAKSGGEDGSLPLEVSKVQSDGFRQSSEVDAEPSPSQKCSVTVVTRSPMEACRKTKHLTPTSSSSHHQVTSCNSSGNNIFLSHVRNSPQNGGFSGSQSDLYAMVPHEVPSELGGVLDALKQAKLSLQKEINGLETVEDGSVGNSELSIPTKISERVEIAVGCAGLFRIPTDFSMEATIGSNFQCSAPRVRTSDQSAMVSTSGFPVNDRLLSDEVIDTRHSIPSLKPYFGPCLDIGLPSTSRYNYPSYPSTPDLMPQMHSTEHFSQSPLRWANGTPLADHFSLYNDRVGPNVYRQ